MIHQLITAITDAGFKHVDSQMRKSYSIDYFAGNGLGLVTFSTKSTVHVAHCVLYRGVWVAYDEKEAHDIADIINPEPLEVVPRLSSVTYPQMALALDYSPFTRRESYSILTKYENKIMTWADFGLALIQANQKVKGRRHYKCFIFASSLIF